MKRFITLLLAVLLIASIFAGCGKDDKLFYQYDLSKYMTVGSYSLDVNKESEDYAYAANQFYTMSFGDNFKPQLTEGKVESGDIANIDYKGLKDGVAFSGGTASGYDLTIGSGTFIPGFEEGLIGAEIGKQINLNLTFPEDYKSAELAGQDVVFEVKINHVTRVIPLSDTNVVRYGFQSLADYEKKADEYALALCKFYNIYRAATVNTYPTREEDTLFDYSISEYSRLCSQYGMTIADLASANSMTEESFYSYVRENEIRPPMATCLVAHYILETYDAKLTEEDVEKKRQELEDKHEDSLESIGYTEITIQQEAAYDKAIEVLKTK